MIVGKAIYYLLTNATDVTDIVSTRVYPEVAQQDADLPFIVYNVTNNEPSDTKPEPSKLDTAQVEVNIYSDSYTEAIDLAVAVRAALDRVKGTYNGVNVQSIQYQNEVIDFDEPQRAYNISADYDVRISRSGFEIAQGSPITGVQLGELSDVNVTGVTNGQLIAYNSTSGNWEAANDAGGAEQLNDLSDVIVSLPASGEVLKYDGGEFVNDNISISDVINLQSELDATPDALDDLTDVKIVGTPADGDALVYSSGFWSRGTAGASALGDLSDVTINTPSSGAVLQYNGAYWAASALSIPSVPSIYYHNRYATEAETLRAGATATVELYYTAQADGDGYAESASSDTATTGFDIRRKLYYSEAAQADPDTGTWVQFADIADDTTFASAKATLLAYLKERTGGTVPISLKMTWEDVAAATLLLDTYTDAAAAYSLRKLRTAYTGDAVEVYNGSSYADIGFDGSGELDTTALATHCGSNDGFVSKWYDQSGNTNTAAQTTTSEMPKIYDGTTGVVLNSNSNPAVFFQDGISNSLPSTVTHSSDPIFITAVSEVPSGATNERSNIYTGGGSTDFEFRNWAGSQVTIRIGDGSTVATNAISGTTVDEVILLTGYNVSSSLNLFLNGTASASNPVTANYSVTFPVGGIHASRTTIPNYISEIVVYESDQSSNRTDIEDNINTFYNIY